MTLAPEGPHALPSAGQRNTLDLWSLFDVGLLYLTLTVSGDMLVQLGKIQSLAWLVCYGAALLRVIMVWPYYLALIGRNRLLLAYPAACMASVLWSAARGDSLVLSVQLSMTILIASYLGWRYSLNAITRMIAVVISVGVGLSLLHWAVHVFPWPVYTRAGGLAGLFSHKNMLGQRIIFGVVAILTIWLMRRSEADARLKLAFAVPMAMMLLALALSKSMTSVLMVPAVSGLLLLLMARRVPSVVAIPAIGLTALAIAIGPVALSLAGTDPVEAVLNSVGKDATLTGRTRIWEVATQVIAEHPVLGVGYGAFWRAGEFANARLITEHAGATTSKSFHNFMLEILVAAGWPALIAMLATIFETLRRLVRLYVAQGSAAAAGGIAMLFAILVTSLLGPSLYRGHEFMIVLLVIFMVSAQEDLREGPHPAPQRQDRNGP